VHPGCSHRLRHTGGNWAAFGLASHGNAATAEAALEEALFFRFGSLGRVSGKLVLRSDNGLVFTSRRYTPMGSARNLLREQFGGAAHQDT